jgi:hypothetical protein
MLGRKDYTQEELDHARSAIGAQTAKYEELVRAIGAGSPDPKVTSALDAFEPLFFNNMALALDRLFVHRLRTVTGKDTNPLNELELICESLMNNEGVLRGNNVVKYVPEEAAVKLNIGDRIRLTAAQFADLAAGVLAEIERKFR